MEWMQTHNWPWWVPCHTERHHWVAHKEGNDAQGGQCDGLWWRHARDEWLSGPWACSDRPQSYAAREEALDAYEAPWKNEYGEGAFEEALRATEPAYQESVFQGNTIASMWEASEVKRLEIEEDRRHRQEERLVRKRERKERGKGRGKGRGKAWRAAPW